MRNYRTEAELREIAREISEVVAVSKEDGNFDRRRKALKREKEIAYGVLFGALLGLNWGEATRSDKGRTQAIIDTAEFTYNVLIANVSPKARGYETIYIPLQKVVREWEQ
mgnify:CR=1 FL=1